MKSASRLSLSVIVFAGASVATFSGWTAETPTDRLPDTSKPGTAQRPGKVDKDSTKNQGMESDPREPCCKPSCCTVSASILLVALIFFDC